MGETIILLLLLVLIEAVFMEVWKKYLRLDKETGETKANKWELRFLALSLAIAFAYCASIGHDLGMGRWCMLPYTIGIYCLQYFVDMSVMKALAKLILKKYLGTGDGR